jgi:hypothetical protein
MRNYFKLPKINNKSKREKALKRLCIKGSRIYYKLLKVYNVCYFYTFKVENKYLYLVNSKNEYKLSRV